VAAEIKAVAARASQITFRLSMLYSQELIKERLGPSCGVYSRRA
jgi:hypothetical protein